MRWPFVLERPKVSWDAPGRGNSRPDHYRILGLHPRVSDKKIKATYRKLAKRLHPDVNASETATERQREINQAYQILGDPDTREIYDAELALEHLEARGRFWRGVAAGVVTFMLTASATSLVALLFVHSPLSLPERRERVLPTKNESVASKSSEYNRIGAERATSDLASSDVAETPAGKRSSASEPTYQQPVSPHSEVVLVAPQEKDRSDEPQAQPKPLVVPTPREHVGSPPSAVLPAAETPPVPAEDTLTRVENLALPRIDDNQRRSASSAPETTSRQPLQGQASDDEARTTAEPAEQPRPLLVPTPREVVTRAPSVLPPAEETLPVPAKDKLAHSGIENLISPRIDDNPHPTPTASTAQTVPRGKPVIWKLYLNAKSGFALRYPADVFPLARTSVETKDRLLTSEDGRAVLHIFSIPNRAATLQEYQRSLKSGRYADATFDYVLQRGHWFGLSGTVGEEVFYERVTLSCDRRSIHSWVLVYPRAERAFYDAIGAEIRTSYRDARCSGLRS